jgi:hypothetical protein
MREQSCSEIKIMEVKSFRICGPRSPSSIAICQVEVMDATENQAKFAYPLKPDRMLCIFYLSHPAEKHTILN